MAKLYNLARMSTATTGTGTITLGAAITGFLTFALAGVAEGQTVTYAIQDGSSSEVGRGVYTAAGTTLTRGSIRSTAAANAAINLSGSAQVFITASAEDFNLLNNTLGNFGVSLAAGTNVTANRTLTLTTGDIDRTLTLTGNVTLPATLPTTTVANTLPRFDGVAGSIKTTGIAVSDADGVTGVTSINTGPLGGLRNRVLNPNFAVSQRVAVSATQADNTYWADRWRILGEAATSVFPRRSDHGADIPFNCLIQMTADAVSKAGIWQVIEGVNIKDLRGKAVNLSATLSVSGAALGNMKMALVEWTGAEDGVAADPISVWGADGVTPTLIASYAFLNTPANLNVTTSPVNYAVTATVGATANNLAVFIWNDDKVFAVNDYFMVSEVQLVPGSATPLYNEHRPIELETALCYRYYERVGSGSTGGARGASADYYLTAKFVTPKRVAPTMTLLANAACIVPGVADVTISAIGTMTINTLGANIGVATGAPNGSASGQVLLWNDTPKLVADAEL